MHRRGGTDDEEDEAGEDQEADKCCQPADQSSRAPTRQATDEQRQTQRNIQPPVSVCVQWFSLSEAVRRYHAIPLAATVFRAGPSTALFAKCANNFAQDDKI
jgi:hypothetical protein